MSLRRIKVAECETPEQRDALERYALAKGYDAEEFGMPLWLFLELRRIRWRDEHDPLAAEEAYLLCGQLELHPPHWVTEWLADSLAAHHASGGKTSLDVQTGFSNRGSGRHESPHKKRDKRLRDQDILLEMWRLRSLADVTIDKAAELVANKKKQRKATCESLYKKNKATIDLFDELNIDLRKAWTPSKRAEFLARYGFEPRAEDKAKDAHDKFLYGARR